MRALSDTGAVGVLIVGPAGAGRSRMARAVADAGAQRGVTAVMLDDAHRQPPDEVDALIAATSASTARIVATVPSHVPLPRQLLEGAKAGLWPRVELGPLPPTAVAELVADVTGAAVEQRSAAELTRVCGGLPLYLVAVVWDALADGSLQVGDGLACWRSDNFVPARLGAVVEGRLEGCASDVREVADALAVAGALPLSVLEELGWRSAAVQAEAAGLVAARRRADRVVVDLFLPAVGMALRARTPLLRRLTMLDAVLAAWRRVGPESPEDRRRLASWALEAERDVRPDELLAAAHSAIEHYEYGSAERLARAALVHGSDGAPAVLAEALEKQGRHADALDVVGSTPGSDRDRIVRAANLYWGRSDLDEATHVLGAQPDVSQAGSAEADAMLAWLLMAGGRQAEAVAIAERVRRAVGPDDPNFTWATVVVALDRALAGASDWAVELARGLVSFESAGAPFERSAAGLVCTFSLLTGGGVDDAVALAAEGRQWALDGGVDLIIGAWYGLSGMAFRAAGDLVAACSHLHQAVAALSDDPYRFSRLFVAEAAAAWAQRGDAGQARAWWEKVGERDPSGLNRLFEPWIGRLGAWVASAEGDLRGAVDRALAAADEAAALGQHHTEMAALHTVARLGRATSVARRAADVASRAPTPSLAQRAAFIEAAAARDCWALTDAAVTFASLGASVLAAEAATAAAHAHRYHEQAAPLAMALELRAKYLARCSGVATPGTVAPGRTLLTEREREVALLAAHGSTSAEIAAKLGLSRRTVDNHLGRVYDKLGVRRRHELGPLFGTPPAGRTGT